MIARRILIAIGLLTVACGAATAARLTPPATAPSGRWQDLRSPQSIWPQTGAIYFSFNMAGGSRAHLVVVDMKSGKWHIRPAITDSATSATSTQANRDGASAAINGGYFNLKGDAGASTSYVVIDGVTVADPHANKTLTENPKLQAYLPQIFNRSELRFLQDKSGKTIMQIAKHNDPPEANARLVHSLQAGPRLLPAMNAEEEAFVRTNPDGSAFDSIGVRKEAARTAFGVTPDGYAMFLTVAGKGQDPESSGVTLDELAELMKKLGCSEAVNLDGGSSSTMYVRFSAPGIAAADTRQPPGSVVCGKNPETAVKSILILEPSSRTTTRRHGK